MPAKTEEPPPARCLLMLFPEPNRKAGTGDWKVAGTRRQEYLRYSMALAFEPWGSGNFPVCPSGTRGAAAL